MTHTIGVTVHTIVTSEMTITRDQVGDVFDLLTVRDLRRVHVTMSSEHGTTSRWISRESLVVLATAALDQHCNVRVEMPSCIACQDEGDCPFC